MSTDGGVAAPLLGSVQDLFTRSSVPLLPCPTPRTPAMAPSMASVEPSSELRRSARLDAKPKMSTMDKTVRVLNKKMGIQMAEDVPLVQARKQFVDSFKTQMSDSSLQALNVLFKLNIPSLAAVDDALIGLAGPGGVEFTPSTEQETYVTLLPCLACSGPCRGPSRSLNWLDFALAGFVSSFLFGLRPSLFAPSLSI